MQTCPMCKGTGQLPGKPQVSGVCDRCGKDASLVDAHVNCNVEPDWDNIPDEAFEPPADVGSK